jgi:hypothetical protein
MANIGQMEVDLADMEARNIRNEADRTQSIGSTIGAPIQASLGAAENVVKLEESTRLKEEDRAKEEQAKALLASGAEGIASYVQSMNFSPEDVEKYRRMAGSVKDEKGFMAIYELIKKDADKQLSGQELSSFSEGLQMSKNIEDPAKFAKFVNDKNIEISKMKSPKAKEDARKTLKIFEDQEAAKSTSISARNTRGASELKDIRSLRKGYIDESKKIDEILRNTGILRSAFQNGEYRSKDGKINRVASDQALIMTFNKILDPTSVVRESEFARTGDSQGLVDQAAGWFAKLLEGGSGLDDTGRSAVYKMSELISQAAIVDKFIKVKEYEDLAGIGNISQENINSIFPGFEGFKEEYAVFKEMGMDEYFAKLSEELAKELDQAKSGVIEGAHKKIDRSKFDFTNKKSDQSKSSPPAPPKATGKIRYELPNGRTVSVDSGNTAAIDKLNEIGAKRI